MPKKIGERKPSRAEIRESISDTRASLNEKESVVEVDADDHEVVEDAIDGYEGSGTAEGVDQTERALSDAENTASKKFEEDNEELGKEQDEGKEFEQELEERTNEVQKDSDAIRETSGPLQNDITREAIIYVKEKLLLDKEYLDDQISELDQALQESESKREDQGQRLHSRGGR